MSGVIRFILDGEVREIAGADPTMTVLQWLRGPERRTGTKEGCAEGDCGACTVLLGDGERHRAYNACILFLPALDGKELVTAESLSRNGAPHPAQTAMVEHHGSQCGFCTPGFVMSLAALHQSGAPRTDAAIDDALAGNLCRCTGYAPIVAAAKAMDGPALEPAAVAAVERREPMALDYADPRTGERRQYLEPLTLEGLDDALAGWPDATLVAGTTDVGLWVTKQRRSLTHTVSTRRIPDLQGVQQAADSIRIGAAVTYTDALAALASLDADIGEVVRRLGSAQVRNAGTIAGNIGNGSPIGDTPPLLIALGASLELRGKAGTRTLALEDYFLAYGKQDRRPGEYIAAVTVPRPRPGDIVRAYKVSKRFDQDISAVLGAFVIRLDGDTVREARIAFGGMAATPKRARSAEAALTDRAWSEPVIRTAMAALAEDFTPISDMRASAAYRMRVAQNLLLKTFLECGEDRLRLVGAGARG